MRLKSFFCTALVGLSAFLLVSCAPFLWPLFLTPSSPTSSYQKYLDVTIPPYAILDQDVNHYGQDSDEYYLLQFSPDDAEQFEKAIGNSPQWHALPITSPIVLEWFLGDTPEQYSYGEHFPNMTAAIPYSDHGYYLVYDIANDEYDFSQKFLDNPDMRYFFMQYDPDAMQLYLFYENY